MAIDECIKLRNQNLITHYVTRNKDCWITEVAVDLSRATTCEGVEKKERLSGRCGGARPCAEEEQ